MSLAPSLSLSLSQIPLAGLAVFALVTSGTPGPNTLLLAHSGLAFGLRRTLPALLGVYLGCALLFALCAMGLASVMSATPFARPLMSYAGGAYLAWLGVGMLKSNWSGAAASRPVACSAAAMVQLVNPKLWWMCAFTLARFSPPAPDASDTLLVAAAFMLFSLPCLLAYASLGSLVTRFARSPGLRRKVNTGLALATLLTAAGVVIGA
jgi:threonine/homoserine/homoserine lactone efflux protein